MWSGNHYAQLDLGSTYSVDKIKVWHFFADGRTYHGVKLQVSANGTSWTTIYDSAVQGEYAETSAGKTHTFSAQSVRYVREYLNGSTANAGDHWVEMEVFGSRTNVMIGDYFEWNEDSGTMVKYYYAGWERIAMREGTGMGTTGLKWLLGDHLGSTSISADGASGAKLSELRFKLFGELRYAWGTTTTSLRYTGQRAEGTGLYDFKARFYDASLGRFIQPDTMIPAGQGVIGFDRYAYVNNNPVRFNDPSGHCIGPLLLVCAGVALISVAFGIAQYNSGVEDVAAASSQPDTLAQEQAAAQQWQDNCMGQCHYADSVSPTPGVILGGARPETPVNDKLAMGYYNIAQGVLGIAGGAAGLTGLGLSAVQQAKAATTNTQYLDDLATEVGDWVSQGGGARVIRNSDGDIILVNDANTRKFRFDLNNTRPHQNPHMHLEWINDQGRWVKPGPIYPSDVDPR